MKFGYGVECLLIRDVMILHKVNSNKSTEEFVTWKINGLAGNKQNNSTEATFLRLNDGIEHSLIKIDDKEALFK